MRIIDSQVHLWWNTGSSGLHRQVATFSEKELLPEMDAAGVDAVVICPPTFSPDSNVRSPEVVGAHPTRFANWGFFALDDPKSRERIKTWKDGARSLGARFTLNLPHQQNFWTDGTIDWLWPAAEAVDLPIGLGARGNVARLAAIAERHPGLRIIVDNMAADLNKRDDDAFGEHAALLALAKFPNVAVKVSAAPSYSSGPYPFQSVHRYVRDVVETFGPRRAMWGTDLTRMPCSYRECVTMFTEEMPWLTGEDLEWVMGRALVEWLEWDLPPRDRAKATA